MTLSVGATTESVTVEATAPLLKSESVEQSVNITGDRINSLPLNFGGGGNIGGIRTPLSFMILSPGVSGTATSARVNGEPSNTYRVFVDGQDLTNNNDTSSTISIRTPAVPLALTSGASGSSASSPRTW